MCYVGRTSVRYRNRWSPMGSYRVQKERRQQFNHLISLSPFSFSPFPLSLLLSNKKKTVCYVGRTSIRYRVRWSPMGAYRVQKERRQQFNHLISLSPFSFSPFPLSLLLSNKKKTVCYVGRTSVRYRTLWIPMGAYRVQKERHSII